MTVNTAIFLGAGASKPEGAPLQGKLFNEYFSLPSHDQLNPQRHEELVRFFSRMFEINVDQTNTTRIDFPTFEEVLGLTDLAILRKEPFRHFDIESRTENNGQLPFIAQNLIFLVAKVLERKLAGQPTFHNKLVESLRAAGVLSSVSFVSTNYDILIDNALERNEVELDYGVRFRYSNGRQSAQAERVTLLKLHGSLNWLFCPTCSELEVTPLEKGVVTRMLSDRPNPCRECHRLYSPLIVPPTFYKDLNNFFLSSIWNRTDHILRRVHHVVFCGYSFPDADMHIKYLLKRAQTSRTLPSFLRITVINHFPGKRTAVCCEEEHRYKRFLGNDVDYTRMSFEDFVDNPMAILAPA